jgi:cell division septum initiation protein DivIVA
MRDDITKLERRLADVCSREDSLKKNLIAAESERDAAVSARRDLLVAGDLSDTKAHAAADRRVAEVERKIGALTDAVSVTTSQRVETEHELDRARDRVRREQEAARARERADQVEQALAAFEAASLPLIGALHAVENLQGHQLAQNVRNLIGAVKEPDVNGILALTRELRIYATELLAGRTNIEKKISAKEAIAA